MRKHVSRTFVLCIATVICVTAAITGVVLLFKKAPAKAAVWNGTAATSFNGGSGTSASPYQIATGEQLKYLANLINNNTSASTYNTSSVYYKLTANIELNNTTNWSSWTSSTTGLNSWTPIGISNTYLFSANFDGGGFVISGVYISSSSVQYMGIFGTTRYAKISNLGVEKSYFYSTYTGYSYGGGIVGSFYDGSITNCYFTGTVTVYGGSGPIAGGIAGYFHNYSGSGTINTMTNCYNTGSITAQATTSSSYAAAAYAGGLVGQIPGMKLLINCYNTGSVKAVGYAAINASYSYAGGIVGNFTGPITNCYNSGSITASGSAGTYSTENTGNYAGGITGYSNTSSGSSITNCYNTGSLSASGSANSLNYTCGISASKTSTISNSYWLSGTASSANNTGSTATACYTFNTSGTVTTKGGTLLAALNEWVTSNNSSLTYYYWKDTPYPTFTGNVYNTYTVTYSYNGATGNNTTTSATVTFGSSYTLVVPTRTGYSFTGWWTATSGGTQYTNASGSSLSNWSGTANITLYAQWTAVSYTVTYNNNGGGTNPTTPTSVAYDSTTSLGVATNRTGYTFGGWYNETGCTTQLTSAAGAIVSGSVTNRITSGKWTPNAAFTVYAKWTANTYTLTYSYNNATGNNTTASATVTYNSSYNLVVPTRTGYTFTGWWSATSGGTQYTNASGASLANWTGTAGITIYAQWTANTYTLTYNYNNATGNNTTTSATVTYNASYNLVVPTRTGYAFTGWWSATSGGTQYTNASGASLANWTGTAGITIYAQWTANTYTLTYNYNNATGNNTTASVTVTYDSSYTLIVPTRTGYSFMGWWSDTSGGTQYTNSSGVSLVNWTGTAGINIYAQWTGYNYTVRFNANNGSGSTSTQSFVYGTAQALTANPYTKQNFKFMGWATSQASADAGTVTYTNSQSVNELTTTNNGTVDLYAVWSTNFATYYLYYNTGVSNEGNSGYVTPGVAIALPTATDMVAYAPTGLTFAGWYENADLSGTAVTQVLISTAGTVKYYYAKWV